MNNNDVQKNYDIIFVGQDYQPLQDAVERCRITFDGKDYIMNSNGQVLPKQSVNEKSDYGICRQILDTFLMQTAPNGRCNSDMLIINSTKKNNNQLYDFNFGYGDRQGYFCGIVGVIKKQIEFPITLNEVEQKKIGFNVTLQIKSRLDVDEKGDVGKPYFLSTMLLRDKVELSNNTVPNSEDEIFDYLLLFWFKEQLQKAILKGYYRTYRRFEKNDDRIKGNIDVAKHIKENMGQKNGRIAYAYRENTVDNYLNHLIIAAYQHLKKKYGELVQDNFDCNIDLMRYIEYLSVQISAQKTDLLSLVRNNEKVIAHPYYTEYEQLRIICLKILRDEGISLFDGSSDLETKGILFYLPELWEMFLDDQVIEPCMQKETRCEAQCRVDNFGYKNENGYKYKQETYPDYLFFSKECPFMVLDAKCKPKWERVFDESSISEVLDDYNKCIRDMVAANVHATGVIFPTNRGDAINEKSMRHTISQYNKEDFFYTIPIYVPVVQEKENYLNWKDRFEGNLKSGKKILEKIVQEEIKYRQNVGMIETAMHRIP